MSPHCAADPPLFLGLLFVLFGGGSAALFIIFPGKYQGFSRGFFERFPRARAWTFSFNYQLMTNPSCTWALRVFGLVFLPFLGLGALIVGCRLAQ